MRVSSLTKATALLSVTAFAVAMGGTVQAAPLTAGDAKCRATIAKNAAKLGSTISKAFDGCIKGAAKAGSGNCQTTGAADTKGKVPGAKTKLSDGIAKSCDNTVAAIALAEHQICGTPSGAAIAGFADVATCMNTIVDANVERWRAAILNPNYSALVADKDANKCAGAIGKNATKLFATIQKEQSKAQNSSDKALGDSNYSNPGDPGGKIGGASGKFDAGLDKSCGALSPAQLAALGSCDDDLAGIKACIKDKTKAAAEGLIASAYDQPGSCPAAVQVKIHHGAQSGTDLGPTELDVGFTGFGHNADVIDDFVGRVNISCGAAPDDCTSCSATVSCAEGNCRCANNITTECDEPFGPDADDCGGNTCRIFFGPPLPLSAAGTPTCVINEIKSELVNTANIATGESDTAIDNAAIVYSGISQDQPCPTCEAGSCNGGARDGQPCSVDGTSEVFGGTSYDCPPEALKNISGSGLKINLDLTDDAVSLPFALPCDPPLGAVDCACSTCTGDNSIGCNSDSDCAAAGAGTCRTDGLHGGAPRVPNICGDGTCEVLSGEEGQCSGETVKFCDGLVKSNGEGIIPCTTDGDCDATDCDNSTPAPDGCGACTIEQAKLCFLDPIDADGTPGSEGAVLVSTFCSAPTASGAVNAAAGTPGPARLALDFEFVGYCANGTDIWGPGGANCQ